MSMMFKILPILILMAGSSLFAGDEAVLDCGEEQPRYLYSEPQIIYEVSENPLYSRLDCGGDEECKTT